MSKSQILCLNSMSRTGTSLLYQLLYGSCDILFLPYRIQFVCSQPYGFPIIEDLGDQEFVDILLNKTTMPYGANSKISWSNLTITSIKAQLNDKDVFKIQSLGRIYKDIPPLERAIEILNNYYSVMRKDEKYICVHDDHSYVLGHDAFSKSSVNKVLTTIRNPVDMVASKKNMLVFHLYGVKAPNEVIMTNEALRRETLRAVFSWLVASYEYSLGRRYFPILFEHLKGPLRKDVMKEIVSYLEIPYQDCLLTDVNTFDNLPLNELLYVGSSLKIITSGASEKTVGASEVSLSESENLAIGKYVDMESINKFLNSSVESFYGNFDRFWQDFDFSSHAELKEWFEWYRYGENMRAFHGYSKYNFGKSNAKDAFL